MENTEGAHVSDRNEWESPVPRGWQRVRLKDTIAECQNGVWGEEPLGNQDDVICVRVADFDRERDRVDSSNLTLRNIPALQRESRNVSAGDLLLEKSGGGENQPVGKVVRFDLPVLAVCSNFIARMRVRPQYDSRFLCYLHRALYEARVNVRSIKQNTGIQNLDSNSYLSEYVALPTLDKQRAIADFLDDQTGKIDALICKQEQWIGVVNEDWKARLASLVCGNSLREQKETACEIGRIPVLWQLRSLNSLTTKITNGYVGPTRDILTDEGVTYLQSLHIKENTIQFNGDYFVAHEWSLKHRKSVLKAGDVLIVQTGDIGQVAVVPAEYEGANCHALIVVSCNPNLMLGEYLSWVLNSNYGFHQLKKVQTGALHPHLNCGNVKFIQIPTPPLEEQRKIVREVEELRARTLTLRSRARQLADALRERRSALIFAAVTGQIETGSRIGSEAAE